MLKTFINSNKYNDSLCKKVSVAVFLTDELSLFVDPIGEQL